MYMDAKWQAFFFAVAIILFVLYAFDWKPRILKPTVHLMSLGLAAFAVPFLWSAVVAGW